MKISNKILLMDTNVLKYLQNNTKIRLSLKKYKTRNTLILQ